MTLEAVLEITNTGTMVSEDVYKRQIYNRAKKLHIEVEARRLVFILETNPDKNSVALESVKSLLGTKSGDFITAVDEKNIIIVKELAPGEDYAQTVSYTHLGRVR